MGNRIQMFFVLVFCVGFLSSCSNQSLPDNFPLNPVLPGDRPNPTIVKVGESYYASATSNEWSPLFPIFKSDDLQNWKLISYVFPGGAPDWADRNFWAPELSYDEKQGKMFVYYTGRDKTNNKACIAVATADSPEGPYTDHGPMNTIGFGAIDPFQIDDKDGNPYLVWKEEYQPEKPSIIWIQQLSNDHERLIGEKHEMIRNDQDWEEHTVEGPSLFQNGDYYYLLFSAGNCCDNNCDYKIGVARSTDLLGAWEKYSANPVIKNNAHWKCPGTGTVIENEGEFYLLYHAFSSTGGAFVGREGVLEKVEWTDDEWPVFRNNLTANCPKEAMNFVDDFSGALDSYWQWRSTQQITYATGESGLMLAASTENDQLGSLLVQPIRSTDFEFKATIDLSNTAPDAEGGIALIGASNNYYGAPVAGIGVSAGHDKIEVWQTSDQETTFFEAIATPPSSEIVELKMELKQGHILKFSVLQNNLWSVIADSVDAKPFTPWGMGFRLGLVSKGKSDQFVNIKKIELSNY